MEVSGQRPAPATKVMNAFFFFFLGLAHAHNHFLIKYLIAVDRDKNISADLPVVSG
jgi:hypothetical protein